MTGFSISWNSADPQVASISSTGLAAARSDGMARIIAIATPTVSGWATVEVDAVPLEITTGSLPNGVVGEFYDLTLQGVGMSTPAWSVAAGALPPGLGSGCRRRGGSAGLPWKLG